MSAILTPPQPSSPSARETTARILVVDDEPNICRLLAHNLGRAGYTVSTAGSGGQAIETFEKSGADLVLLDLKLPDMAGLEVLRHLRRIDRDLPVIVLTAHGSVDTAVEAMKLGAHDFLAKPFELERLEIALRNGLEIRHLAREVRRLRCRLAATERFSEIIGAEGGLRECLALVEKVLPSDLTVLLTGASGTGKDLFARVIHAEGPRSNGPFLPVNCAALPEGLLESELFGHEKGAFTGATSRHIGKFEQADGGTLFLDEIADMAPAVQAKLLRVLQDRTVFRLGGNTAIRVDVRVICATHQDLERAVAEGRFREDLYYRLAVFPVHIPPLRDRKEDIPALVDHVIARAGKAPTQGISAAALECLESHDWPGNVRELQNVIRRALVLAGGETILPEHLPPGIGGARSLTAGRSSLPPALSGESIAPLEEVERQHVRRAVEACRGNLSQAARRLGIGRTTLYRKLKRFGLG
ncbi:MAG: sigma-54 dependent transcriptional regulator [Acidobacteriota bacterium]|nr:sigma-54 dependent transcriptional regulator [Acidobacteriota bacterium]MDQ7087494.1 sigma-54 dependent transcriptional regulator [Acidobacteriota bacterium]